MWAVTAEETDAGGRPGQKERVREYGVRVRLGVCGVVSNLGQQGAASHSCLFHSSDICWTDVVKKLCKQRE